MTTTTSPSPSPNPNPGPNPSPSPSPNPNPTQVEHLAVAHEGLQEGGVRADEVGLRRVW